MTTDTNPGTRFLDLHAGPDPLLLPNPWDVGTAKVLEYLGFAALATTSSGHAASLGRQDGRVTRDEALAHAAELVSHVGVPVSADLENGFADDPEGTAETVRLAAETGLAGCSVEDWDPARGELYSIERAKAKMEAAAEAARSGSRRIVLTGRAENFFRGKPDLADTIARLQAYQEAGADVLYAPAIKESDDLAAVVAAVDRPVNVLAMPGVPSVGDLGKLGVRRVSVGGAFAWTAYGALAQAANELLNEGTYGYWNQAAESKPVRAAFDE